MTLTLANPADTYVSQAKSTTNYNTAPTMQVSLVTSKTEYGLLQFSGIPSGPDVLIASAHLLVYAKGTWTSTAVTAEQITGSWSPSSVKYSTSPAVTATNAVTVTHTAVEGTPFDFDITAIVQLWAAGASNLGIRLRTTSTTLRELYSANATGAAAAFKPVLVIEWSRPPTAPTSLCPTNNQQVSIANPTITFKHGDPAGLAMNAYQIQTNATNVWTSPTFDSGTVSTSVQQHTLAAAVSNGQTLWYRIRTRNTANQWGPFSDGQQFGRTNKGTVTITVPAVAPNDFVEERTPPFAATFSGTATSWQMLNSAAATPDVIGWDSLIQTGAIAYTSLVPISVDATGHSQISVLVWDNVDRATTPGDPPYTIATRTFTYIPSTSVTPFSSLALVPPDIRPQRTWTFGRATPSDSITIERSDGKVWTDLNPVDLQTSGTTYEWTDSSARPELELTYKFVAVVNGQAASSSPTSTVTMETNWIWIFDEDDPDWFIALEGDALNAWTMGEESAAHEIRGADSQITITEALRGYEDTLTGNIKSDLAGIPGVSAQDYRDRVWDIKANPAKTYRVVLSDINIPVVFRQVAASPVGDAQLAYEFSALIYQQGELPWS